MVGKWFWHALRTHPDAGALSTSAMGIGENATDGNIHPVAAVLWCRSVRICACVGCAFRRGGASPHGAGKSSTLFRAGANGAKALRRQRSGDAGEPGGR